ncbi:hypothetical protein F480_04420 [Bibersteinia trehalosi Y31]|uniref:Lipoprotein n=1 Tax=Bibersteinia trehalosi Y31 TaxID=1261658 RepID=A0A179D111_BIBTR|nr:hypothetical protein [Bibersteinia trehalosi]OAQ15839.1 hypothetical protein F480_04420 [Bibersteinia trehalosi Y31]
MKKIIFISALGLIGCGTGNPLASKLEDYQGNDTAILQVKNYLDTTISFYEKDLGRNCLLKKDSKVMNNQGIFNHKNYRVNYNSPFSYLGKSIVEYNIKPNQYVRLSVKPNKHWVSKDVDFKVEPNKYYLLDVKVNDEKYSYRIIDIPNGKEKVFSNLGEEYNANPWDLEICN